MVIERTACESTYNKEKIQRLLEQIQITTENYSLYILACIHRSIVNERASYAPEHNERLEFLGDAVLELSITELLYTTFPDKTEGELTDIRSALVRGRNLALIARKLELGSYLLLGNGEEKSGGRESDYILANTLEAIIGAIYLDKGYGESHSFITSFIFPSLQDILDKRLYKDYKTLFQEESQAKFDITPRYEVLDESGPDHDKVFIVGAYLGEKLYGKGSGSSKKKAQEKAAENAFNSLN
ncbi:ribonuclease III [Candidatus Gracilibacteria bacterium]|nr:ribonuclease III [Candidatus Gracilibacteria bacterium]